MIVGKIEQLKKLVIEEANLVEKMINFAIDGLLQRDANLLIEVELLEAEVNNYEVRIDREVINIIALQHPEAKHLRTILMISKMNNDLERMGDLAVNIAENAHYLIKKPIIKKYLNLPSMAEQTQNMLRDAITSFIEEDRVLAAQVCENDDEVDDLNEQIYRVLITYMMEDPKVIKRALKINRIAACLERIADLSTNIAEETIFIAVGQDIKHQETE
ncbi:MAG: phosphate signaling complex protein PhoU [Candidatus Cloacimonadales bacterium]